MTIEEAAKEIRGIHVMISEIMKVIDAQDEKIELLREAIYKLAEISDQRFCAPGDGGTQQAE